MPVDEFWHGDMRLLEAYQKAYLRNTKYTAWINGNYVYVGVSIALANAFRKKGENAQNYVQYDDPIENFYEERITEDNLEEKFREQQIAQQRWLHDILHKGKGVE